MSRKIALSSRAALLVLLLVTLAVSFVLLTPKPAAALTCQQSGGYLGETTVYYADANYTTIACSESCGDSVCDPTPYVRYHSVCCSIQS